MISPEQKAKLHWQCRRGMLELDLILNRFLKNNLEQLDSNQLEALLQLLTHADPEIYSWLMGNEIPKKQELASIVAFIRLQHHIQ